MRFFALQFLQRIYDRGFLQFDHSKKSWSWDLKDIRTLDIAENVIDFLIDQFSELPEETLKIVKLASCIGSPFDPEILSIVGERSIEQTSLLLIDAIRNGVILASARFGASDQIVYKFAHDRILQAVYTIVSEQDSSRAHYAIGRLLLKRIPGEERQDHIFDIVNQLNRGIQLIEGKEERIELAELNFLAGSQARRGGAYDLALFHFEKGLELTSSESWSSLHGLKLKLYNAAGEAAYLVNQGEKMISLTEEVFQNTDDILDKIVSYELRIFALRSAARLDEAVDLGLRVLKELSYPIPNKPSQISIIWSLVRAKMALGSRKVEKIHELPAMDNSRIEAILRIISGFNPAAFFARPTLVPLTISATVRLSLKHGNNAFAAGGYAAYGLILCGFFNDARNGNAFGDLAEKLMDEFKVPELEASTLFTLPAFVRHWKYPIDSTIGLYTSVYEKGLETGDHEFVGFAFVLLSYHSFYLNIRLPDLLERTNGYQDTIEELQESARVSKIRLGIYQQVMENLTGDSDNPLDLTGSYYEEESMLQFSLNANDLTTLSTHYSAKLMMAVLFDQWEEGVEIGSQSTEYIEASVGLYQFPIFHLFYSLALLRSPSDSKMNRKLVLKHLKLMKKWANNCPENYSNKLFLLEAILLTRKGHWEQAIPVYEKAIEAAHQAHFQLEEALAWEYLAHHYDLMGDKMYLMRLSLRRAFECYREWGAKAKCKHLEQKFPFLGQTTTSDQPLVSEQDHSDQILDFRSIIKASTAISGEIVLDGLLDKMMRIVVENAGAQYGILIMKNDGIFQIKACLDHRSEAGQVEIIENELATESERVPAAIINSVIHKNTEVLLDDGANSQFRSDAYITKNKTQSVLCTPIIHRSEMIGILYLENNLTTGVFTGERVQFISLLAGQIGVSLENVKVYEDLEETVRERTQQIQQEKEKSDDLLLNILPDETAKELKETGKAEPKFYSNASVMFVDFKSFSAISKKISYQDLVGQINKYFSSFDHIIEKYHVEKIKTIGDSYMCVSGLPKIDPGHAENLVKVALDIQVYMNEEKERAGESNYFEARIGIHSGPVIAGVVGSKKFAYDIWGDTVNVASRIESAGQPGQITISQSTYEILKDKYACKHAGKVNAKNIGDIDVYEVQILK